MKTYDTIIVGGGIAGLTAASYIAREGKSVILFEKEFYLGGLINSFERDGFLFDGGLRATENSGILFPMLNELEIDIEFVKNNVSLVNGKSVLKLDGIDSIEKYQNFLISDFPNNKEEIKKIIKEIKKITQYMQVLYGIDNPIFKDLSDFSYIKNEILPWIFKFLKTIKKIEKLKIPINTYLKKFTSNQQLIDNISQHFFKKTPASFALSYFSLYNDYYYPIGGTAVLPKALEEYSKKKGAELKLKTSISDINPEKKFVIDNKGKTYYYSTLIWAADLKKLYDSIDTSKLKSNKLNKKILKRKSELNILKGAESVFSTYLSVDIEPEYFKTKTSEHIFYTPHKNGISNINLTKYDKESIKNFLYEYIKYNTLEISIPSLRDSNLSPEGKTGIEISLLFDYNLSKIIIEQGWKKEFKFFMEKLIIEQLMILYPKIKGKIINRFSSTPQSIEHYTGNSEGAIVGWSFTNPYIPVVNKLWKISKSINTVLPNIYKAGQWTYSPAGMPISILTGKIAANKVLKQI